MLTFLLRTTSGRFMVVTIILISVSAPIGYFTWRAKTQSTAHLLEQAREKQKAGKKEQAKIAYDRAVSASKTVDEKQKILRDVAASYREANATSPMEALENYTAAIAAETKILQDSPADKTASENTLEFYAGMLASFGPGSINLESALYLTNEKLKANPTNAKAANLLVQCQVLLWRRQSQTIPSKSVIKQRLAPASFNLENSLTSCAELIRYLHSPTSDNTTRAENTAFADELATNFESTKPAMALIKAIHQLLSASDQQQQYLQLEQSAADAKKLSSAITDPTTAIGWINFLSRDRRLIWDNQQIQSQGDVAAQEFINSLPEAIRSSPKLTTTRARVQWRLNDEQTEQTLNGILSTPLAIQANAASLHAWSEALEAATIMVEVIANNDDTASIKNQKLDDLSRKFTDSFGGEALNARITIAKQLTNQWYYTAGASLLERTELGDPNALFWSCITLKSAGATDAAFQLTRTAVDRASSLQLPGRYVWKLMEMMSEHELRNGRPDLSTKRLAPLAGNKNGYNGITEAYLTAQLIELIVQAKQGKSTEALEQLELLTPRLNSDGFRESAALQATVAALLAECGNVQKAVTILEKVPLSPTVIAVWPGLNGGHVHAWEQLRKRLRNELKEHQDPAIKSVAKRILDRADASRAEFSALQLTATHTTYENRTRLLALQIALGHSEEATQIIHAAEQQDPQPLWLANYKLSMAMRRGDWPQVLAGLNDPTAANLIDPVQRAYVQADILTRQGKSDAAIKIVEKQLDACNFHRDLWLLRGQLSESKGELQQAKEHYGKAAALNHLARAPTSALHRVLQKLGDHSSAARLLATRYAKSGNISQLAGLSTAQGAVNTEALISALEAQRAKGPLTPNLETQLMILQWKAGRRGDAQATAAAILKQYPNRLSFILPALGYRSDPEATEVIANYRANASRPLIPAELLAIAQFWRLRGYANREGEILKEAATAGNSPIAIHRYADWQLRMGKTDDALSTIELEWKQRPTLQTGLQLAEAAVSNKNRKRALDILNKLTRRHHGLARIELLKAFLTHPEDPQTATQIATAYIQNRPLDPWGWYYRAKMQLDDPEAAPRIPKDLQQALKLAPEMEPARMMLADWMLKHGDAVSASQLLETGEQFSPGSLKMGVAEVVAKVRDLDGTGACNRAEALLSKFPRVALAQRIAMFTFLKFGRYYRALPLAEQFLSDAPESVIELNNMAHLLATTGENPERGLTLISKAIELVKDSSPYLPYLEDTRTVVLVSAGQHQQAIELAGPLQANRQPAHDLYLAVACAHANRLDDAKQRVAAAQSADDALKQSEEWYLALADLSQHLPADGSEPLLPVFQKAATSVEEHTGSVEISARIYASLAAAQIAAGNQRAAILATLRRSSSYAKNPWAAVLRAEIIAQDGDANKTNTALSQARELLAETPVPVLRKRLEKLESSLQ